MEIHVPEGNILEVHVPHETIVEIIPLKTTAFKSAPIEVVSIAISKFFTEVLIIFGYYSCKESRGEQYPVLFENSTHSTAYITRYQQDN